MTGPRPTPRLDALTAEVAATTTVEDSVLQFIDGLQEQLAEAIASGDPVELENLTAALATKREAIAAAISAETPSSGDGTTGSGDTGSASPGTGPVDEDGDEG
jgi:selenocysteine lyase/cysteine desulfurase